MTARHRIIQMFDGTNDTLTYRRVAEELGMPEPSVRREMRQLELDGYLELTTEPNYVPREFARVERPAADPWA